MIYLDYSATTKADEDILDTYKKVNQEYFANSNAIYKIGRDSNDLISLMTSKIADLFNVLEEEIIYTGSASEANNLAIKGITYYSSRPKRILSSTKQHASVTNSLKYLEKLGYDIVYLKNRSDHKIDLDNLKEELEKGAVLLTLSLVSSEVGVVEDLEEIKKILRSYPRTILHVDGTQAVGKINFNLDNVDLFTLSQHKLFGLKSSGILIKKSDIILNKLIDGGESTSIYRSGTADQAIITCFYQTLKKAFSDIDKKYNYVKELNNDLREFFKNFDRILINSLVNSSPHILNLSFKGIKIESFVNYLSDKGVYISTRSACSIKDTYSREVYSLYNDLNRAETSFRISLSYKSSRSEIESFKKIFEKAYNDFIKIEEV